MLIKSYLHSKRLFFAAYIAISTFILENELKQYI